MTNREMFNALVSDAQKHYSTSVRTVEGVTWHSAGRNSTHEFAVALIDEALWIRSIGEGGPECAGACWDANKVCECSITVEERMWKHEKSCDPYIGHW